MTRPVTFWYTKQLPIFENNDDMATTKIDVTRSQSFKNFFLSFFARQALAK
jgi:hypothetical protein